MTINWVAYNNRNVSFTVQEARSVKPSMAGSLQRLSGRLLPRLASGGCWQSLTSLGLASASLQLSPLFSHGRVPSVHVSVFPLIGTPVIVELGPTLI